MPYGKRSKSSGQFYVNVSEEGIRKMDNEQLVDREIIEVLEKRLEEMKKEHVKKYANY